MTRQQAEFTASSAVMRGGPRGAVETARTEAGGMTMATKPRKVVKFESFLVVEGRVPAMLDMLRYDTCSPATETQAARMEAAEGRPGIFVLRMLAASDRLPTTERWRSFGCDILGVHDVCADAEAQAETYRAAAAKAEGR